MKLYNTLSRKVEDFVPNNLPKVGMYTCGPTVYWSTHIGHMVKYVGDDLLRRALIYLGYEVREVMNITDVGHLVSDGDEGEDKMEKGAVREGLSVWDIAKKYEKEFFDTLEQVNFKRPDVVCRATEHVPDQIELIKRLEKNGLTYETDSAIYYDVAKFPDYNKFTGQTLDDKKTAREDVVIDSDKKNSYDFVLWFKCVGRFENHVMRWNSPWGEGFPGWHIECSAMAMKYLGESFEIHTGGEDHLGVHHPAEIAQSEGATGKEFVKYWVHRIFLMVDGKKMGKSLGNMWTIEDIKSRGFDPLALRYLFLLTHYRQRLNFTWDGLTGAQNALNRLYDLVNKYESTGQSYGIGQSCITGLSLRSEAEVWEKRFRESIEDDLNMPKAIATVWEMVKDDEMLDSDKLGLLLEWDKVLGLDLGKIKNQKSKIKNVEDIPARVTELVEEREKLRKEKKWAEADEARKAIEGLGYEVKDSTNGSELIKIPSR